MKATKKQHRSYLSRSLAFMLSFILIASTFFGDYMMAFAEEGDAGTPVVISENADQTSGSEEASQESIAAGSEAGAAESTEAAVTESTGAAVETGTETGTAESTQPTESTETTIAESTEATAVTETAAEKVTIHFSASEGGTVSLGEEMLGEADEVQSVTAIPNENYEFVDWTKDGVQISTDATFTPAKETADYVANFKAVVTYEKVFNQSKTVNGILISLYAVKGVLPDDAVLEVNAIDNNLEEKIADAIDEQTAQDSTVEKTYTFDIKIHSDLMGKDVQPQDGTVEVTFEKIIEQAAEDTAIGVYHVTQDNGEVTGLDEVAAPVAGTTDATFDAEHFSLYTITLVKSNGSRSNNFKANCIRMSDAAGIGTATGTYTVTVSGQSDTKTVRQTAPVIDGYQVARATYTSKNVNATVAAPGSTIYGFRLKDAEGKNPPQAQIKTSDKGNNWVTIDTNTQNIYFWYEPVTTKITFQFNAMKNDTNSNTTTGAGTAYTMTAPEGVTVVTMPTAEQALFTSSQGRSFLGWSASATDRTDLIEPGSTSTAGVNTYYAVWSYLVTFAPNSSLGGSGTPFTEAVSATGKLTLPEKGTDFTNSTATKYFIGWHGSQSGHDSGSGMLQQTYNAGAEYPNGTTITSDITLYAVWLDTKGTDGQGVHFYIQKNGTVPYEPKGYDASDYYPNRDFNEAYYLIFAGTLKTKIEVNNNLTAVADNILTQPTPQQIKAGLAYWADKISFDPDKQKVVWYVIKEQGDGWHVDGTIVNKETYSVEYNPNGGNNNIPDTAYYAAGVNVNVDFTTLPTRAGYTFVGWDISAKADFNSPMYTKTGTRSFTMPGDKVTLYAIWKPNSATNYTVERYYEVNGTYTGVTPEKTVRQAATASTVTAESSTYSRNGFFFDLTATQANKGANTVTSSSAYAGTVSGSVAGDGSTVLKLYYKGQTELVIQADSSTKTYDGEPLTDNGYTLQSGTLAAGDEITAVTVTGSQTNADTGNNVPSNAVITHTAAGGAKTDVSAKYVITYVNGALTVNPVAITLKANSASKAYDGKPLTAAGYRISSGAFVGTDGVASVAITGSQTLVGTSANTITGHTLKAGTLAANYAITYEKGTLEVTQASIAITIKAADGSKIYDGSALTNGGYTMSAGTLAEGDAITAVTVTGSQTNAGTGDNIPSAAVITHTAADGTTTDVSANYAVTYTKGELTVNPVAITLKANSDSKVYDGKPLTAAGYRISSGAFVGTDGVASVAIAGSQTLVGTSDNTITGHTLKAGTLAANYAITYEKGILEVTQASIAITIKAADGSKIYDGSALTNGGYTMTTGTLAAGDAITAVTVTGSQTNAGTGDNIPSAAVITHTAADGTTTDVSANYAVTYVKGALTVNPAAITLKANSASKAYDGKPLTETGYSISKGAFAGTDGVASVTTKGSQIIIGSSDNVITGHTLTAGTLATNYTITYEKGTLEVTGAGAIAITVTAASAEKDYNAEALTDPNYTLTAGQLATGDSVTAVVSGTITDAGSVGNLISDIKVIHTETVDGKEVKSDVTNAYAITPVDGTLKVNPAAITLTAASDQKVYDSTPLTNAGWSITKGAFAGTDGISNAVVEGTQTYVGSSENSITGYTLNTETNANNYIITTEPGKLEVTPASIAITIKAADDSRVYNGASLENAGYEITEGALLANDTLISTVVTGSQRETGSSDNIPSDAVIMNGDMNVTANYAITYTNGTLTVTPRPITLTAGSASRDYDGTPLTNGTYTMTGTLADTDTMTGVTVTGSQTAVGSSANVIGGAVITRPAEVVRAMMLEEGMTNEEIQNGTIDVTGNYTITYVNGTLTINEVTAVTTITTQTTTTTTTATATAPGAVLGAQRGLEAVPTEPQGEVLGATRAPKTSDESKAILWMLVMGASGIGMAALLAKRKKGRMDEEK